MSFESYRARCSHRRGGAPSWATRLSLVVLICIAATTGVAAAQRRRRAAKSGAAAQSVTPSKSFAELQAKADAAREASQFEEAIDLYRQGVKLRPAWGEGWWYLATLLYDRDEYSEAAQAFKRAAQSQPKLGAPLAMAGICEFQLGNYDEALAYIRRGRLTGLVDNNELKRSMRYYEGSVLIIKGQFEHAQQTLSSLSAEGVRTESLIIALGLAALRIPELPKAIAPAHKDRDLIRRAGWSVHLAAQKNFADADREYERLAADYPKISNVQYAYGRHLLNRGKEDEALTAFHREIDNSPNHSFARLQIAFIKLIGRDPQGGLKYAEDAVRLLPNFPLGYYVLGRLQLDLNMIDRAIESLETSRRIDPEDPKVYFALARTYTKAKRKADADRARETFARLNREAEKASQRSYGITDSSEDEKNQSSP